MKSWKINCTTRTADDEAIKQLQKSAKVVSFRRGKFATSGSTRK
jgi:hypothetical protein